MKKVISLSVIFILLFCFALPAFAQQPRLVDDAGLLTDAEAQSLTEKLDTLSTQWSMDFVVVTTGSLEGKTATAYADDYFDYNGYGMGSDYSGILFLVSMEDRDWAISTYGNAISVFTDYNQETIMDEVLPYLSDGYYYDAFDAFASQCDEICQYAEEGDSFPFFMNLLIAVGIGFLVSFIATSVMKGKLKSVRAQAAASSYMKQGSLQVTESRDVFLYRTVSRTAKPKETSSSSTHTSSSGRTHGGSSGKF